MAVEEKVVIDQAPSGATSERAEIVDAGGKFVLAAIGAVALTADAVENVLERMVKRGELTQKHAQRVIHDFREQGPRLKGRATGKLQTAVPDTLDVPSKADVQALHDEIAALSAKLDQLKPSTAGTPVTSPAGTPK